MPSQPVRTFSEIFNVLKGFKIFHDNKELKKKKFREPDGTCVWEEAAKMLAPMRLQNLYLFVRGKNSKIRKPLRDHHFPRFINEGVEEIQKSVLENNDGYGQTADQNNDNSIITKLDLDNKIEKTLQEDEYIPLHEMKYQMSFHDIIHRIGIIPFCVTYWSSQQTGIYKDLMKIDGCHMCVIVLNDLLPSIKLKSYTSNRNSLVSIACHILDKCTFLGHLITESFDKELVQQFIVDFFKKMPFLPSEITVAYHRSTMNEICFALNTCFLNEHNSQCLCYLEGKSRVIPKVLIRIDLMSLLISVSRSPHFLCKTDEVQKNLIKFIIYLKYVSSLEIFRTTVTEILLVILTPFEDQRSLDAAASLELKTNSLLISDLYEHFKKLTTENTVYDKTIISDVEADNNANPLANYIDSMKPVISTNPRSATTPNSYYCESLYKASLQFVLADFPVWTCLLSKPNEIPLIENVLQNHIDLLNPSTTISDFVETHIVQCDELVQRRRTFLNQKRLKKSTKVTENKVNEKNSNVMHLDYQENWGGLNECFKKKELIIENKLDETETKYDLAGPPLLDGDIFSEQDIILAKQNVSDNFKFEAATIDLISKKNVNTIAISDIDQDFAGFALQEVDGLFEYNRHIDMNKSIEKNVQPEPVVAVKTDSFHDIDDKILLSRSVWQNEKCDNSEVLGSSSFVNNRNNDWSLDTTIGIPHQNSTPILERITSHVTAETAMLDHNYSTLSELNQNLDSNIDEDNGNFFALSELNNNLDSNINEWGDHHFSGLSSSDKNLVGNIEDGKSSMTKGAVQKVDIAIPRTATARGEAELADISAEQARDDLDVAQQTAKQIATDFRQPGLDRLKNRDISRYTVPSQDAAPVRSILHTGTSLEQQNVSPTKQSQPTLSPDRTDATTNEPSATRMSQIMSMRRASVKQPLPQNVLLPSDFDPPSDTLYTPQSGVLPQNQFPSTSPSFISTVYPAHSTSQQHVDQCGYAQQSQNPYPTDGYANQQLPAPNQYGFYRQPMMMSQYRAATQQKLQYAQQSPEKAQQLYTIDGNQRKTNVLSNHRNSRVLSLQNKPSGGAAQTLNDRLIGLKNTISGSLSVKRPLDEENEIPVSMVKKKRKVVPVDKKRKYLTPCPDMSLKHQFGSSKSNRKDKLIRNGNVLEPRSIKAKKYNLENTSEFDVLVEILSFGYKNCLDFRNYCDNTDHVTCNDTCLLKIATKFSKKSNLSSFYADRAALLYGCATINESLSNIAIDSDLNTFFGEVMSEHASFNVNIYCEKCASTTVHQYFAINLEVEFDSFAKLQDLLLDVLEKNVLLNSCHFCNDKSSSLLELGSYLAIHFKKGKFFDYVDSAPTYITLSDKSKYMIIGVVTFKSDCDPLFVAYCRRPTGNWEMRSGMEKKIFSCKFSREENIVLLMYLKIKAKDM